MFDAPFLLIATQLLSLSGKPLTPYHTKKERQRLAEEAEAAKVRQKNRGIFLQFKEPRRFSARRDNCHVIDLNRQLDVRSDS